MEIHKAIRHITLAQASRVVKILQRAGHTEAAAAIACTADCLQFNPTDLEIKSTNINEDSPSGKSVRVCLVENGEIKLEKLVPASLFKLYDRKALGLQGDGQDTTQAANAEAARTLLTEFHKARLGIELDAASATVLAGRPLSTRSAAESPTPRLVWVGLASISLMAFALSFWQFQRTFNFIDFTYLMENLNRINQGQIPYRDFYLVLPPIHYWIHGLIFKFTGGNAVGVAFGGALVQALTVLAAFWACQSVKRAPYSNLIFAIIPAVTGAATLGMPSYDSDAILAATLSIGALLHSEKATGTKAWGWSLTAGAALGAVILTKINIGLPLLVGFIVLLACGRILFVRFPWASAIGLLFGTTTVLSIVSLWLANHQALGPMIDQTIRFPAQVRLHPLSNFIASLPLPRNYGYDWCWAVLLLSLWGLLAFGWFAGTHRRPVLMLLPVALMAICLGAMQSQGFGSVYGLGAVASLILALNQRAGTKLFGNRASVATVGFALLFSAMSMVSNIRQKRLAFMEELLTEPCAFSLPHLHGSRGYCPTVHNFESAVTWAKNHIKPGESAFWWPGTAPFYVASGLPCPLKNFQVFGETGLAPEKALEQLKEMRVTWVLVDHSSSRIEKFGEFARIESEFTRVYELVERTGTTAIYHLRNNP